MTHAVDLRPPEARDRGPGRYRELSVWEIGQILVRRVHVLVVAVGIAALVALVIALRVPRTYTSDAVILPQGAGASNSAISRLAGEFGFSGGSLSVGEGGWTAAHYIELLGTEPILEPIVRSSFTVATDSGPAEVPFLDLFNVSGMNPGHRVERGMDLLRDVIMRPSESLETGMLRLQVTTRWPEVSAAIANRLVSGLERMVLSTRQVQAGAERDFVHQRIEEARSRLRAAEDSLQAFLSGNRAFEGSAELVFEQDRLKRSVALRQQLLTGLLQAYEEARIREVRDTPTFTVIDPPGIPAKPDARGRLVKLLVGILTGGVVGLGAILAMEGFDRARAADPDDYQEFMTLTRARLRRIGGRRS